MCQLFSTIYLFSCNQMSQRSENACHIFFSILEKQLILQRDQVPWFSPWFSAEEMHSIALPSQLFGREIPERQSPIRCTRNQVERVRRERTDPDRAAARMLQDSLDLTRDHRPDHCGRICGARSEELATGTEAAAVDTVAVSRQRWKRQLREVTSVIYPEGFVPGTCG